MMKGAQSRSHLTSDQISAGLKYAESILSTFFDQHLTSLFSEGCQAAVVGGAIRDLVIAGSFTIASPITAFRDLDIAVFSQGDFDHICSMVPSSVNRYGGAKLRGSEQLRIDLWAWDLPRCNGEEGYDWESWLERIDFAINAAVFLWPSKRIVTHSAWESCIAKLQVDRLTSHPIKRHRDVFRAVGLQCRWGARSISPAARNGLVEEIFWLLRTCDNADQIDAFKYFRESVNRGRYPMAALALVFELISEDLGARSIQDFGERFESVLSDFPSRFSGDLQNDATRSQTIDYACARDRKFQRLLSLFTDNPVIRKRHAVQSEKGRTATERSKGAEPAAAAGIPRTTKMKPSARRRPESVAEAQPAG